MSLHVSSHTTPTRNRALLATALQRSTWATINVPSFWWTTVLSYAALYDVEDVKRGSAPTLRFKIKSSAARLTDFDDAKWEAVKRWNARMKERTKARLLE